MRFVSKNIFSEKQVKHIAQLANIPISKNESQRLAQDFAETLAVVDQLKATDVSQVTTTHQVTGFKNITREDEVDETRSFTQEEALANANQQQDGYFLVPQVLKTEDN
jgi:aspartyl/glutamyl-tRNA(Asn/Gln) amidotransferase C subunit